MFGLTDPGVALAFLLTIASTILCVVYGIVNWNKPNKAEEDRELAEEEAWEAHDPEKGGS